MCYNGTFRFKKLDDSFWNGETFRFADYICRYRKCILMRADNAGCETDGESAGRYGVGSADKVHTLSTHFLR